MPPLSASAQLGHGGPYPRCPRFMPALDSCGDAALTRGSPACGGIHVYATGAQYDERETLRL